MTMYLIDVPDPMREKSGSATAPSEVRRQLDEQLRADVVRCRPAKA